VQTIGIVVISLDGVTGFAVDQLVALADTPAPGFIEKMHLRLSETGFHPIFAGRLIHALYVQTAALFRIRAAPPLYCAGGGGDEHLPILDHGGD
jgi:hypothetical protein